MALRRVAGQVKQVAKEAPDRFLVGRDAVKIAHAAETSGADVRKQRSHRIAVDQSRKLLIVLVLALPSSCDD